jgi:hypothetical protein
MLCIGICTVPYIIPLVLYDMMRDDYRSWRDRAPPKVIRRKRALSLSRKNDTKPPLRGRTATQTKSLFFKLPAELRMMVYEELVGKGEIHLAVPYCKKDGWKVRSYRCLCPLPTEESGQKVYIHLPNTESHDSGRSNLGVMGLLQSCRSMYVIRAG